MWWVLIWACSRRPEIRQIDPEEVRAGESIRIQGDFLDDQTSALLMAEGGQKFPLEEILFFPPHTLEGVISVHTPPGVYGIWISDQATSQTLTVEAPRLEIPCTGEYTTNTQLSLARKLITIDRFHRNGRRETLRIPLQDVQQIEYEERSLEVGKCWVIFLHKVDGSRVVFDDDPKVDLKDRAQKMARDLEKPLQIL